MPDTIRMKPHHFVDILCALGDGTRKFAPAATGHALHLVAERILGASGVTLVVELGADEICAPCRLNVNGSCTDTIDTSYRPDAPTSKQEWNLLVDRRWCERLGIGQGDRLTAREFCGRLQALTGDIEDIYREIPPRRTRERARRLREGVRRFLEESVKPTEGV